MKKIVKLTESDLLSLIKRIIRKGDGDTISQPESKLDNSVFKHLNNQGFIQIKENNRIYFVNSKSDKYAQIRYDKNYGWCLISDGLIKEISSFFSMENSDSKKFIAKWVENTLQMRVKSTDPNYFMRTTGLTILSK